jgi:hypothetical protein
MGIEIDVDPGSRPLCACVLVRGTAHVNLYMETVNICVSFPSGAFRCIYI